MHSPAPHWNGMEAQTMLSQDVWLSVRLSVTRWYCVEMAKRVLNLFHHCVTTPF